LLELGEEFPPTLNVWRCRANCWVGTLHHLPEAIPPIADQLCQQYGLESTYAREWDILGTAGGIRGIWRALGEPDAPLVVTNGDSVMNIALENHLEAHREAGAAVSLVVRPRADDQPGKVWLDEKTGTLQRIRDFEAPAAPPAEQLGEYDFTGLHILEPSVLSDVPLERGDIVDEVYGPMLEQGTSIRSSIQNDFWAALDNPELLMATTRRVLDEPELFDQAPLAGEVREDVYAADPEVLEGENEIEPPVFVGENVEVADDASVGPYAVLDGVSIGEEAEVEHAILYGSGDIERTRRNCVGVADRVAQIEQT